MANYFKNSFLCNDIWWDCLPWLGRAKVGLALALVSDRHDRIADRFLARQWTLGDLRIIEQQEKAIIYNVDTKKELPLPEGPLPENAVGFKGIVIG